MSDVGGWSRIPAERRVRRRDTNRLQLQHQAASHECECGLVKRLWNIPADVTCVALQVVVGRIRTLRHSLKEIWSRSDNSAWIYDDVDEVCGFSFGGLCVSRAGFIEQFTVYHSVITNQSPQITFKKLMYWYHKRHFIHLQTFKAILYIPRYLNSTRSPKIKTR